MTYCRWTLVIPARVVLRIGTGDIIGWATVAAEILMDPTVARLNIEHFRKLLSQEKDEAKRQTILRLLAEEELNQRR